MALQGTGIADLIAVTLENVEPLKFTDISTDLRRYVIMNRMLKKNKVVFDTGPEFQWELMTDQNYSARFAGLYAQDIVNPTDVMKRAKVGWAHMGYNWGIERREIAMNRSPRKIVDLALTRRMAALISAVVLLEQRFWRVPAVTDNINPFGVPYWIVKNATEGFNGTVPSGYTYVGNVSPTEYPRWANYTFQYATPTRDDLIRKWRKAADRVNFETPVPDMPTHNTGDDCVYYSNYDLVSYLVELLQAQNDDLGNDIAACEGKCMFMQNKVVVVPQLDDDTTNPIYGINHGEFKTAALRDEWLNESKIDKMPGQHTVSATFTDLTMNWFTRNRRRHFVGATGTTLP